MPADCTLLIARDNILNNRHGYTTEQQKEIAEALKQAAYEKWTDFVVKQFDEAEVCRMVDDAVLEYVDEDDIDNTLTS